MKDPNPETRGTVGVLDFPIKELGDDEVLIKVAYCGICGSSPHVVDGCFNKPEDAPFGIGHEMSGVIEKLGKNATAKGLKSRGLVSAAISSDTAANAISVRWVIRNIAPMSAMSRVCTDVLYGTNLRSASCPTASACVQAA